MSKRGPVRLLEEENGLESGNKTIPDVEPKPSPNPVPELTTTIHQVVSISLISTEIFKNLSIHDLLQSSLVDKSWNTIARSFLRDNEECLIHITGSNPCKELQDVNNLLNRSFQHLPNPFNGINISPSPRCRSHKCLNVDSRTTPDVSKLYPALFTQIPMKYLRFNWDPDQSKALTCPGVKLIEAILTNKVTSASLIGLTIEKFPFSTWMPSGRVSFKCKWKRKLQWPKLKYLTLPRHEKDYIHPFSLNELLAASPKLEALRGHVVMDYIDCIVAQEKSGAVQEFILKIRHGTEESKLKSVDDLLKFALSEPKNISKLYLSTQNFIERFYLDEEDDGRVDNNQENFTRLQTALVTLLEKSNSFLGLKQLDISHLDLLWLSTLLCEPFVNLKYMVLRYSSLIDTRPGFSFSSLCSINFTEKFPHLKSVEISADLSDTWSTPVDSAIDYYISEDAQNSEEVHACWSVTHLTFSSPLMLLWLYDYWNGDLRRSIIRFSILMARTFRHVVHLIFNSEISDRATFKTICDSVLWSVHPIWYDAETMMFLNIDHNVVVNFEASDDDADAASTIPSLDPLFTGLTLEQCAELCSSKNFGLFENFDKEEKYGVVGVIRRTMLRNLKELKLLHIKINHGPKQYCQASRTDADLASTFVSEVTGHCAFALMPNLTVEIDRVPCKVKNPHSCSLELNHLKPFVKLSSSNSVKVDRIKQRLPPPLTL